MKKFLAIILAVICVFSMASAFTAGAMDHSYVCDNCGGTSTSVEALNAHLAAKSCGKCQYCEQGFNTQEEIAEHEYVCPKANIVCDYCGDTFPSNADFDEHIEDCKAKHFNIPVAKILEAIKSVDWESVFAKISETVNKLAETIKPVFGNLGA